MSAFGKTFRTLAALAGLATSPIIAVAEPLGHAVPTTYSEQYGLTDMVVDSRRNLLYFTDGPFVKRVNLATNTLEAPIYVNGILSGLDLSPDGNTLAVADNASGITKMWIKLVDLNTGKVRRATVPRQTYTGGSFRVAYLGDGTVVVSLTSGGSSDAPLRRYHPNANTWSVIHSVAEKDSQLAVTGDGKTLLWAGGNTTIGLFGRYVPATGALRVDGSSACINQSIAANSDGSLFAISCSGNQFTSVWDANFNEIGYFAGGPVAWAPVRNIIYVFSWDSFTVKAYDMDSGTQVGDYDMGSLGSMLNKSTSTLRLSRDGSMLMAWSRYEKKMRYHRLYAPLAAALVQVTASAGTPKTIALAGSLGIPATLTYSIVVPPQHGTAVVSGAQATYAPAVGFHGNDSFNYRVQYGQAFATGVVKVVVP